MSYSFNYLIAFVNYKARKKERVLFTQESFYIYIRLYFRPDDKDTFNKAGVMVSVS